MGLGERVCCRAGLAVRGGMEGLVDKGFALRGGTGGAFRSRHSSLTWRRKEHSGLATGGQGRRGGARSGRGASGHDPQAQAQQQGRQKGERRAEQTRVQGHTEAARDKIDACHLPAAGQADWKRNCWARASRC